MTDPPVRRPALRRGPARRRHRLPLPHRLRAVRPGLRLPLRPARLPVQLARAVREHVPGRRLRRAVREPVHGHARAEHVERLRLLPRRDGHRRRGRGSVLRRLHHQPVEDGAARPHPGRPRRDDAPDRAICADPGGPGAQHHLRAVRLDRRAAGEPGRGPLPLARPGRAERPDHQRPAGARELPRRDHARRRGRRGLPRDRDRDRVPHLHQRPRRRLPDAPVRRRKRARHRRHAPPADERVGHELRRGERLPSLAAHRRRPRAADARDHRAEGRDARDARADVDAPPGRRRGDRRLSRRHADHLHDQPRPVPPVLAGPGADREPDRGRRAGGRHRRLDAHGRPPGPGAARGRRRADAPPSSCARERGRRRPLTARAPSTERPTPAACSAQGTTPVRRTPAS